MEVKVNKYKGYYRKSFTNANGRKAIITKFDDKKVWVVALFNPNEWKAYALENHKTYADARESAVAYSSN